MVPCRTRFPSLALPSTPQRASPPRYWAGKPSSCCGSSIPRRSWSRPAMKGPLSSLPTGPSTCLQPVPWYSSAAPCHVSHAGEVEYAVRSQSAICISLLFVGRVWQSIQHPLVQNTGTIRYSVDLRVTGFLTPLLPRFQINTTAATDHNP